MDSLIPDCSTFSFTVSSEPEGYLHVSFTHRANRYNSVIVLSIPAAQSYQVTLSDTFFTIPREQLGFSPGSPADGTSSSTTMVATTSSPSTHFATPSSNADISSRINIQTANQLLHNDSELYTDQRYATSPFVAFKSESPTNWPGLDQVNKDLVSLLQNTGFWNSSVPFEELSVSSTDWYTLDFDECLKTFSIRYRPYAGTVFLVLGMTDKIDVDDINNEILGMSYLSYHESSLSIACPTAYANRTNTGLAKNVQDAPILPLLFGTFDKPSPELSADSETFDGTYVCPSQGVSSNVPHVKGCLLRNRTSFCRLGYNSFFFCAILVFLAIKIILLSVALYCFRGQKPLLTIGDTIAEYLKEEDRHTKESCLQEQGRDWTLVPASLPATAPRPVTKFKSNIWRLVYPGRSAASTDSCLREDIISYSHRADRGEIPAWVGMYFVTLLVTAAIFTYVGLQDGWVVRPSKKG
jgi:hypothetical protein